MALLLRCLVDPLTNSGFGLHDRVGEKEKPCFYISVIYCRSPKGLSRYFWDSVKSVFVFPVSEF
jgi:hypothetical protein